MTIKNGIKKNQIMKKNQMICHHCHQLQGDEKVIELFKILTSNKLLTDFQYY